MKFFGQKKTNSKLFGVAINRNIFSSGNKGIKHPPLFALSYAAIPTDDYCTAKKKKQEKSKESKICVEAKRQAFSQYS